MRIEIGHASIASILGDLRALQGPGWRAADKMDARTMRLALLFLLGLCVRCEVTSDEGGRCDTTLSACRLPPPPAAAAASLAVPVCCLLLVTLTLPSSAISFSHTLTHHHARPTCLQPTR